MKRTSTTKTSAEALDADDAPPLTKAFFKDAEYRVGGKKVTKAEWAQAARAHLEAHGVSLGKKRVSIMLDASIIEHFKAAAGERGYQTLINETLKKAVAGEALKSELRMVLREELAEYRLK